MKKKAYTLAEVAELTDTHLIGNPAYQIAHVADLEHATAEDASFLANPRYEQAMQSSKAGVIFIHADGRQIPEKNFLISDNPTFAFQKLVNLILGSDHELTGFTGIHPTAVVHESVELGHDVRIGPRAVIDKGAVIGSHTTIGAGVYIGPKTVIGAYCTIHPNVTIRELCTLGDRVVIQPGAVIGSCGFGFTTDKTGKHIKLDQLGTVTIEQDVEIGANTCIDRSRFKTTRIKKGTKIDNLVQIAHGVELGQDNLIVAQTGIAGSTETGNHVILAGQVAVAGHLQIGNNVIVTGRSGVTKSLTKAGKYGGIPAYPLDEYNRNSVYLRNIERYVEKIKALEQKCDGIL